MLIRDFKVMVDSDIAELYGVSTKRLNEQVKRNKARFPKHFMFELTKEEKNNVVANCDHLEKLKFSPVLPKVFTEHGILMAANVLTSERAIKVSIQIIEVFVKMRSMLQNNDELLLRMEKLERNLGKHDMQIAQVFQLIKQFVKDEIPRKRIGFKPDQRD
ncbi:MAG: ORF6N domain-containing protein [Leeuwenhoekiella sp.]